MHRVSNPWQPTVSVRSVVKAPVYVPSCGWLILQNTAEVVLNMSDDTKKLKKRGKRKHSRLKQQSSCSSYKHQAQSQLHPGCRFSSSSTGGEGVCRGKSCKIADEGEGETTRMLSHPKHRQLPSIAIMCWL